jgi:hypothetical protein
LKVWLKSGSVRTQLYYNIWAVQANIEGVWGIFG